MKRFSWFHRFGFLQSLLANTVDSNKRRQLVQTYEQIAGQLKVMARPTPDVLKDLAANMSRLPRSTELVYDKCYLNQNPLLESCPTETASMFPIVLRLASESASK